MRIRKGTSPYGAAAAPKQVLREECEAADKEAAVAPPERTREGRRSHL